MLETFLPRCATQRWGALCEKSCFLRLTEVVRDWDAVHAVGIQLGKSSVRHVVVDPQGCFPLPIGNCRAIRFYT